ncbi:MAG TPA: GNAT family N-acetyltransferase [Acetobacteraceae bacterium]|nr:GNAT family N-acetyltransferase [Acetobacteraceae bacterium]
MPPTIRTPAPQDEPAWRALWAGYNRFYRADVPEDVTAALWRKLLTPSADITGLVAEQDGALVGLAHLLFHPSTWSLAPTCYLEDLFVARTARGSGAGKGLIETAATLARARGADRLYWHTQEFNAPARSLYDTVAERTSFIVYRKSLS